MGNKWAGTWERVPPCPPPHYSISTILVVGRNLPLIQYLIWCPQKCDNTDPSPLLLNSIEQRTGVDWGCVILSRTGDKPIIFGY